MTWFDRAGNRLGTIGQPADYSNPSLSPDGTRLAVCIRDPHTQVRDIWIFDLTRGTASRLTFEPGDHANPVWSRDGTRIAFNSDNRGHRDLYWKAASGTGIEELLLESTTAKSMEDWSPDGRFLIFNTNVSKTGPDIWMLPVSLENKSASSKPVLVFDDPREQGEPRISPNGRWIAYRSLESGANEVFVRDFPATGAKWQISISGGIEPKWRKDGRELFFRSGDKLSVVDISADGSILHAGIPKPLFQVEPPPVIPHSTYDVTPDGKRFLVNIPIQLAATPITVVLNWTSGLKR